MYNVTLQTTAVNRTGRFAPSSVGLPSNVKSIEIGDVFFESYSTWPDTKFTHGFSLGLAGTSAVGWSSLLATVPTACKALGNGKLLWWEYGNEPDLYANNGGDGQMRSASWDNSEYVSQWQNGTRQIKKAIAEACPNMVTGNSYGYIAPSFWVPNNNKLTIEGTWNGGLNVDNDVKLISFHKYVIRT